MVDNTSGKWCCFLFLIILTISTVMAAEKNNVLWVWSGAITSDSAIVKAKVSLGESEIRLILSPDSGFEDPETVPAEADCDGVAAFSLEGLKSNTLYHYAVEVDGRRSLPGRLRTFADGPMSFLIGFASCATTGSNHEIWTTIQNQQPLFFLHMGDFHYENIKRNDPALYRKAFDRCLTSPRQGSMYRHTPIAYVWDDHDFGPNDADGTSTGKPAALEVYEQYVPHYPLFRRDGTLRSIQQAFTVGRVRFIMTDVRSERMPVDSPDGPDKSMLGEHQRDWLEEQFAAASSSAYALVVWVNVVPWITKNSVGSEHGWEPFHYERRYLADRIKELGLVDRLLILSGDGHMVAIDDGTNSNYATDQLPGEKAFPVVHAAPIHRYPRVKGGPYSHGTFARKRLFGIIQEKQFGLMQVNDDGQALRVELSGHNSEGRLLKNMKLSLTCDERGCSTD
jgi:alkaline phosphatase D